uniref:Multidrug resistance-associated protein 4-like n=1 Tax=Diabrotica virgifera virgifera TaxID=50390 RepID=A0A6P7H6D6_DIAVI
MSNVEENLLFWMQKGRSNCEKLSEMQETGKRITAPLTGRNKEADVPSTNVQPILDFILDHAQNDERPYLRVSVLGTEMLGLLDSGASRTIVGSTGWKLLRSLGLEIDSSKPTTCRVANGQSCKVQVIFNSRLYNYEGQIYIDGTEIKTLSLPFLRQHISIIPQDPIMFSGSIRSNIDPLEQFTDEDIWQTLHKVQLNNAVPHLQAQVGDLNFSTGQRQLICLARAIIKRNKIVVLDEATANMDPETERTAQKIIDENFSACTILIIAHRLDAILDCDKVMVLDRGQVIEFDEPNVLLNNESSLFAEMIRNAKVNDINNDVYDKKKL